MSWIIQIARLFVFLPKWVFLKTGIGGSILLFLFTATLLCALIFPYDPSASLYTQPLLKPNALHWLGTDHLGRDILTIAMAGLQVSFLISFTAVTLGVLVGVIAGSLAAMLNNALGDVISRIGDFTFAFPVLVVALLFRQALGSGSLPIIIAIGLFNAAIFTRVTYGSARPLWTRDFILAARAAGKSKFLIAFQHILPNITNTLIVLATVQLSMGILTEAALSWLGVGIQPPTPSLGRMLMESTTYYWLAPQLVLVPTLLIVLTVLSLNQAGDHLRDHVDPKLAREY